jgi:hypothetical protein
MSTDAICALPIRELATDAALLFMWTIAPHLREALQVVAAWGFEYDARGLGLVQSQRVRGYLIVADEIREPGIESTTGRQCVRVIARSVRLSNRAMPSHQAEMCREKAAEAKRSAARAPHPSIKTLFEEVASSWLRLAEQTEWIERRASEARDEGVSN